MNDAPHSNRIDNQAPQESLPRSLGLWSIWLLAVNGFIGAGIFGLPSGAARLAGEYSPLIYLLCALLILPILLCFGELASYFRGTGGPVRYCTEAFGPFLGFQVGWLLYLARIAAGAANTALLADNIGYFFPSLKDGVQRVLLLTLIVGGLTLVNVIGSVRAIRSLATLTALKLGALLLLAFAGIAFLGVQVLPHFDAPMPSAANLGAAALLLIYAFVGFEGAVIPGGESKNPGRDMPLGLLLALATVALLYMLIQTVCMAAAPAIATSSAPLLDAATVLLGPTGSALMMLGVLASVGGNLVSSMFATPRISYALALDKNLPSWFGRVHSKFLTPANSIVCYGALILLFASIGSFLWLAVAGSLTRLVMYALVCAAVPKLRQRYASSDGLRLPGGALIPLLGLLAGAWLMLQATLNALLLTLLSILIGSAIYWASRRWA